MAFFAALSVVILSLFFILKPWRIGKREKGLPPGPPTRLIIGNALQFPKAFPHFKFTEWARQYGEIFSLKVLNQTIVVLTSPTAVKAILDKQGLITGNRPKSFVIERTEGVYISLQNMDTHAWKTNRKAAHMFLTPEALEAHSLTQRVEYAQFLNDVLESPENLYTHVRRTTVSIMSTLIYGKRCPEYEGSEAEAFYEGTQLLNELTDPVAHPPVDLVPILRYVPSRWAPWKALSDHTKATRDKLYSKLFLECEKRLTSGKHTGCFIETVIENQAALDMTGEEINALGRVLMDGGAETTSSFLLSMILALINFPSCQKEAQLEIDRVFGNERLLTIEDLDHLPYVRALIKEVHRFRPVFPVLLPHVATQDVLYKDYRIPKGAIIFTNLWGIHRDPQNFDDPEVFRPERYLKTRYGTRTEDEATTDGFRDNLQFGSGRRICPGEEMGSKNIAINTMSLLWAFDFTRDQSGTGSIDIDSYGKPGIELSPKPFSCKVSVRDEAKAALIREWHRSLSSDSN